MFIRAIGRLGLLALSGIALVVIATAVATIAGIAFPGLVPNFSE